MGLRYQEQYLGACFFVTTSFKGHSRFGDIPGVYERLAESLSYRLDKTQAQLTAYVFMPSHIHLLLLIDGKLLASFMRDFKKYTAQKGIVELCRNQHIWQPRYDRQAIITLKVMLTKINYIHLNPVKAELVEKSEDWNWSSAADYLGREKGPVPVFMDWYCV